MEVGELLPRLSILTVPWNGGLFLLPFSGGYPRLTLSATLPYDARTFLTILPFGMISRGRPAKLPNYYTTFPLESQDQFALEFENLPLTRGGMETPMDPSGPYRLAWRPSPPANVRSSSRAALLDALEYGFPVTRLRLAELTHLGETTVRRACRQLLREQVLTLSYGTNQATGRHHDRILPALHPVLPVLEITEDYLVWRLFDTRGGSVFATVRDRSGYCTPEDDLAVLMGQVTAILRAGTCGLPADVPLQPPVLLLPDGDTTWQEPLRHVLPQPPAYTLTPE